MAGGKCSYIVLQSDLWEIKRSVTEHITLLRTVYKECLYPSVYRAQKTKDVCNSKM